MRDPASLARDYLAPPALAFWRWTESARVLVWPDGSTIAFREELETVLSRLAPAGLPPFGAVVLLLSACRPGWKDSGRPVVSAHVQALARVTALGGKFPPPWLNELLNGLDRVHAVRIELRTGAEMKASLASLVFERPGPSRNLEESADVMRGVAEGAAPEPRRAPTVGPWTVEAFLGDLEALRAGLGRVTDEALELRARTGLDALPGPAALQVTRAEDVRRLLEELREDAELAGLARLAENLMAAVHVPRRVSDPEELPLGGVSDIANRGPLDRLLVSELANDELTLAARVALNEALYLRREQPPRNLPGRRAILFDCGIRMWGVPRVFGAAVGLALAATADRAATVAAYRATAEGAAPADLATREGILGLLGALETEAVPAAGLAFFLEKTAPGQVPLDAVLVTHEDVLADPDFATACAALDDLTLEVAAVGGSGRCRMWSVTRRGRRLLREAHLSLDAILAAPRPEPRGIPLLPPDRDAAIPAALSADPFPFLLPHEIEPRRSAPHPVHGVVCATRDGRLMHWAARDTGARQLTAALPRGVIHWISVEDEGFAYAVVGGGRSSLHLVAADLASGRCTLMRLPATGYPPASVFRHQDALVLAYHRKIDVFDIRSGEIVEVFPIEHGASWGHGRFLCDSGGWACVAFTGTSAAIERVPKAPRSASFLSVFDRRGLDGPWALHVSGKVVCLADGKEHFPKPPLSATTRVAQVSRDGHRIALATPPGVPGRAAILDLEMLRISKVFGDALLYLEPAVNRLPRRSLRHRFAAAAREDRTLVLVPASSPPVELTLMPDGSGMALRPRRGVSPLVPVPFLNCRAPDSQRFGLKVATWSDGSRAWLDTRGLLHLRSSDVRIPEISVVLTDEGFLAAWSADGRACGPRYFLGDRRPDPAHAIFTHVFRFTGALP